MNAQILKRTKTILLRLLDDQDHELKIDAHLLLNDIRRQERKDFQLKLFTSAEERLTAEQ